MFSLTIIALLVGFALLILGGAGVFGPDTLRRALTAFPRNRAAAVAFTLINVLWVAIMVYHAPLGRFEWIKPLLYILAPSTFFAVLVFMDELLAPRMLGGFLLLIANPALNAARWHESDWRLVLTLFVYVWIVWAMILVLSPYRFRHTAAWVFAGNRRLPVFGGFLALGALLIALASAVY